MSDLILLSTSMFAGAAQRLEVAARNVANMATPGFKRQLAVSEVSSQSRSELNPVVPRLSMATDFEPGKLVPTGNVFDLALTSAGFFELNGTAGLEYTRSGRFDRDGAGHLVTPSGAVLQGTAGDIVVRGERWHIERDGTVVDEGTPVDRLRIVDFENHALLLRSANGFSSGAAHPAEVDLPVVVQGSYEASNVATADDMLRVMSALRGAEAGQKLVRAYDDMLGTVLQHAGDLN